LQGGGRKSAIVIVALVSAVAIGVGAFSHQIGAQDTEFLKNFRLGPSADEVAQRERMLGITEPVHVPADNPPSPGAEPVRFGAFYLIPEGWSGPLEDSVSAADPWDSRNAPPPTEENIRASNLWLEPDPSAMPRGFEWRLVDVTSDGVGLEVRLRYQAPRPSDANEETILDVIVGRPQSLPIPIATWSGPGANLFTPILIDQHAAVIWAPADGGPDPAVQVDIFDESTGIRYVVHSSGDVPVNDLVTLARSLYR
jgi:hypothetical protein